MDPNLGWCREMDSKRYTFNISTAIRRLPSQKRQGERICNVLTTDKFISRTCLQVSGEEGDVVSCRHTLRSRSYLVHLVPWPFSFYADTCSVDTCGNPGEMAYDRISFSVVGQPLPELGSEFADFCALKSPVTHCKVRMPVDRWHLIVSEKVFYNASLS